MVDLALKILLHDRLRFFMTVMGVTFADVLVLVQMGLFLGLLENASCTIDHLDADLWVTARGAQNIEYPSSFPESYVQRVRAVDGVARADNLIVSFAQMLMPSGTRESALVYALEDFVRWNFPWNVPEGDRARLRQGPIFFLDDSATKRLGAFRIGEHREVVGKRLEIAGRTKDLQSFTSTPIACMPFRLAQSIISGTEGSRTNYVIVKLAPGANREAVRARILAKLPLNEVSTKEEWAARCRSYWVERTGLGLNIFLSVFLGCVVGVVVVAQTLYSATMEHLGEFGTIKAIGGTNADIYAILGKQSCIAAVAGFATSLVPVFLIRHFAGAAGLRIAVSPELALGVLAGTVLMCLGAGAISFRRIARIDPALVFRG